MNNRRTKSRRGTEIERERERREEKRREEKKKHDPYKPFSSIRFKI
jgi:hypothetical protein